MSRCGRARGVSDRRAGGIAILLGKFFRLLFLHVADYFALENG